jgi:hypothetical protein
MIKKRILPVLVLVAIALFSKAQALESFTATLQTHETGGRTYLSIANKKSYTTAEAKSNKTSIDMALVSTQTDGKLKMEWYNMSGKDGKISEEMIGTATLINAISVDKDQFNQCKTNQDLNRMTGHITKNAFSHFASVSDDVEKGINYHCFIVQFENGKRALLWLEASDSNTYKVTVKVQA